MGDQRHLTRSAGSAELAALRFACVDLFFVISGFIISNVVAKPINARDFATHRAFRILPFYWLFTAAWLVLVIVTKPSLPDPAVILASFAGFPLSQSPLLGVGWSLEHEFISYGLVAALIALGGLKALPWVLAGLFTAGLVAHVAIPELTGKELWDSHLVSLHHVDFLLGVLIYRLQDRLIGLPPALLLIAGVLAFPIACVATLALYPGGHVSTQGVGVPGLVRVTSFGVASALLISGLISLEAKRPNALGSKGAQGPRLIGDSSYTLYLLHPILFAVLGPALARLGFGTWAAAIVAIGLAVIAAFAFYEKIERPYQHWLAKGRAA